MATALTASVDTLHLVKLSNHNGPLDHSKYNADTINRRENAKGPYMVEMTKSLTGKNA